MSAANRKLAVSVVESVVDTKHVKRQERTWESLIANLAAPQERAAKRELRLLKLVAFGDKANDKGSLRHNANVVSVSGLVGDYDARTVSLDEAAARLKAAGIEAFLYTTPSHTAEAPRWRVLAPLSVDVSPEQHAALMDRLNGALGGILASESWTLSQVFYVGKVRGVTYDKRRVEGQCIDLVEGITPIDKRGRSAEPTVVDNEDPIYEPTPAEPATDADADADQIERWRARLDREDPDMREPDWWAICARLVESSGGNDEAYELFDEWSSRGTKYKGPEDTRKKWDEVCARPAVDHPRHDGTARQCRNHQRLRPTDRPRCARHSRAGTEGTAARRVRVARCVVDRLAAGPRLARLWTDPRDRRAGVLRGCAGRR